MINNENGLDNEFNVDDAYLTTDSYNTIINRLDSALSFVQMNIRSFHRNSDEFIVFLSNMSAAPDVIVLTETWFTRQSVEELDGYNSHHVFREERRGGGVSIFIREGLKYNVLPHMCNISDSFELCSCEVIIHNSRLVILGIYRPPDRSVELFTHELNQILSRVRHSDHVLILGDLNIDLCDPDAPEAGFIDSCQTLSFVPLITVPTRVTDDSARCLDHAWYNQLCDVNAGVFDVKITDHFPCFVILPIKSEAKSFYTKVFRDHSSQSLRRLREDLLAFCEDFRGNLNTGAYSLDNSVDMFLCELYRLYDVCCPIRSKSVSCGTRMKPWLTRQLKRCIREKHNLFRQYKRGLVTFQQYNSYKNRVSNLIRVTKSKFYINKFNSQMNDVRGMWKTMRSLVNRKSNKSAPSNICFDGNLLTDPNDIANCFNNYFNTVATNLDSQIPQSAISPLSYMGGRINATFFVAPVTDVQVFRVINNMRNVSSSVKNVPVFIYKHCVDILSGSISELFNLSISCGLFPSSLKEAKVIPIFKSGDVSKTCNYRPISTLSILSKILEKLMCEQLSSFIARNSILSENQFGFRKNMCTSDAVLEYLNHACTALNDKNVFVSVFLDFSKAFDTVNHSILLRKLEFLGIRGLPLEWFKSYLYNRVQYVNIAGVSSRGCVVQTGVPQGSVLGPMLFLLYINDMSRSTDKLHYVHFADDTTVFASGSNLENLIDDVNNELRSLTAWLHCNRLSLNLAKTSYMIVTDQNIDVVPSLCVANVDINLVVQSNFLGIKIDNKLNFKHHVDDLCKQVARTIGMMYRISYLVPPPVRKKIYYSLLYSKVSYGVVAWGGSSVTNSNRIERLLKRARVVVTSPLAGQPYPYPADLFNFDSIYRYFTLVKFYRIVRLKQHSYFGDLLDLLTPTHDYTTRFSDRNTYNKPLYLKSKCQNSFLFRSVGLWNGIPEEIKTCATLSGFKKRLKNELLSLQNVSNSVFNII